MESFVNVRPDAAFVFPAASAAVTTSVGEDVVAVLQLNVFELYGPPAGVETVEGVCDQPVAVPPSAAVALDAGPDSPSATAFVIFKLPAAVPR